MATTTTEESSTVLATTAPEQPKTRLEPESVTEPEPSKDQSDIKGKCDEEEVDGDGTSAPEQERDPEWVEERFRIDRKKLEHMLYCK